MQLSGKSAQKVGRYDQTIHHFGKSDQFKGISSLYLKAGCRYLCRSKTEKIMKEMKLKTGKIEEKVVGAYQKIEDTVVETYQKIEDAVVGTYQKIEDKFVEKFLEVEEEVIEIPEEGDETDNK